MSGGANNLALDGRMTQKFILLVEDNPDDEALALRALQKNNISNKVSVARDGAEALDFLFAQGAYTDRDINEKPVLVLLDLKLPKIDGLEVLKRLRSNDNTRRLPIVVMTSSSEKKDVHSSYNLGANSYIRKPVDFVQFTDTVAQLGQYWLQLNEAPYD